VVNLLHYYRKNLCLGNGSPMVNGSIVTRSRVARVRATYCPSIHKNRTKEHGKNDVYIQKEVAHFIENGIENGVLSNIVLIKTRKQSIFRQFQALRTKRKFL
jgi:hypothetical protein